VGGDHVPVVEIGARPIQPEIVNIGWGAAVGRAEAAASGGAHRIYRHIIDGLAQRVSKAEGQPLLKAPANGEESRVIVRVAAGVEEEDLAELRIGPEIVGGEAPSRNRADAAGGGQLVDSLRQVPDTVELEVVDRRAAVDEAGAGT